MRRSRTVGLFGTGTRTRVLLTLAMLERTYASELARILKANVSLVQKALASLETAGVIVGSVEGRQRTYSLNPRSPYRKELTQLLERLATLDVPLQKRIAETRRRPRRAGKEL